MALLGWILNLEVGAPAPPEVHVFTNLDAQVEADLLRPFLEAGPADAQAATDLLAAFLATGPTLAQSVADLDASFLRTDMGWGTFGLLAATGDVSVPVTAGTTVKGIFDRPTSAGDERDGPTWWGAVSDGYQIGSFLTVTGEGTYQIAAMQRDGDGRLAECLLEVR